MNTQNARGVGEKNPLPIVSLPENEPQLISVGSSEKEQTFTLKYKERFLYSKYNPKHSVLSLIENTQIPDGTIIILCSPCLWYGLDELISALRNFSSVQVCAIEADRNLFLLSQKHPHSEYLKNGNQIHFYFADELDEFESFLNKIISSGSYKRVLRLDFSAGVQFNPQWYSSICTAAEQMVASYWKNRITIVKMGRLFSHNIFKNLCLIQNAEDSKDTNLDQVLGSVTRPIIVLGAGESLDKTFDKKNESFLSDVKSGRYFVMAVDAASQALKARGIKIDAIVAVEGQSAIQDSYSDFCKEDFSSIILFADLCSRTQVARPFKKRIWFVSEYSKCAYLDALKEKSVMPSVLPPLGSVGLTAVYIALLIRKNIDISVFVTGFDFSYSAGITHAKNVSATKKRMFLSTRLISRENFSSSFLPPAFPVQGKDGKQMYTSPIMESYAATFKAIFSGQKNLYDVAESGIDLHLKRCTVSAVGTVASLQIKTTSAKNEIFNSCVKNTPLVKSYLENEKAALNELKDLLVNGESSSFRKNTISLDEQILALLKNREYLFLHFPDGTKASLLPAFLKRVRAELDGFLKILN